MRHRELVVLRDTRERDPWEFGCRTLRRSLRYGDYTARGLERSLTVERKSAPDLALSLSSGLERLCRLFAGAAEDKVRVALVVECSWREAEEALRRYSPALSLKRRAAQLFMLTGAIPLFMGSRLRAVAFTTALFEKALELERRRLVQ